MVHRFDILHPSELDEADARAWRAFQTATPVFSNPLLSPQFAQAVGLVREDARIAICRSGAGSAQGFLAYHKRPSAFARPIGAPLSDLQALVSAPQAAVDASALFGAAGVRASPAPKNTAASVTDIASTSLMSRPPNRLERSGQRFPGSDAR